MGFEEGGTCGEWPDEESLPFPGAILVRTLD